MDIFLEKGTQISTTSLQSTVVPAIASALFINYLLRLMIPNLNVQPKYLWKSPSISFLLEPLQMMNHSLKTLTQTQDLQPYQWTFLKTKDPDCHGTLHSRASRATP